jgi:hypothetical protein
MITDKYELEEVAYGTTGWNAIMSANMGKIEANVHSLLYYPVGSGETILQGDPVSMKILTFYKARRNTSFSPMVGIAIEDGVSGEVIRAQRVGAFSNPDWNLVGSGEVYLTDGGSITSVPSGETDRPVGVSIDPLTILIQL